MALTRTSCYISLILRHKPETIGITLDEHGWASVDELIAGVSRTHPLTMESLEEIVRTDEKQRYSFNGDKTLIRANQGHSIPVDVELPELEPPAILYHGTGKKYGPSIDRQGLLPKSRLYVHLSADKDTAAGIIQNLRNFSSLQYVAVDSIQEVQEEADEEDTDQDEAELRRYVEFTVSCTYYPNGYLPGQELTFQLENQSQGENNGTQAEGQVE